MDRIRMLVAAVGFSALCAHSPAQADPPVGARDEGPIFVTVNELYGRVLEATEDSVLVEFVDLPGSRSRIPLELVPPDQRYRLKKRTIDADDAAAWLKLADFAKELGLHVRHIEALETAKALDPSLEGVEERLGDARQNCAVERLGRAQELRAQGALRDAIAHLETTIRHYEACAARQDAEVLLADVRAELAQEREEARATREAERAERQAEAVFGDVVDLVERGDEEMNAAREALGRYVEARRRFGRAIALFEAARERLLAYAAREREASEETKGEAERLLRRATARLVTAHVELGYVYTARGDDTSAYTHAGKAAILAPDDPRVAQLRAAIAAGRGR